MNKVFLIGRITKDVQLQFLQSGTEVIQNTLAVNRKFKNSNGEKEVDFINFVGFGATANIISQYAAKGNLISLEGRWQKRSYQSNDGKTVYVDELVVENVELLEAKREPQYEQQNPYNQPKQQVNPFNQQAPQGNPFAGEVDESDLPF